MKEGEVKVDVKVVAKGLRSLATGTKKKDKLSSVEKGWKEIFEDEENAHPGQTGNKQDLEQMLLPVLTQQNLVAAKQAVPVQNIYLAPEIKRVGRTYQMPMLPSQPPSWGW